MAFRVRDLMIDVAPGTENAFACLPYTGLTDCRFCTHYQPSIVCYQHSLICPNRSVIDVVDIFHTCGTTIPFDTGRLGTDVLYGDINPVGPQVANPQNLAVLKAQLRQSLAQVEAQEQAMAESMKPQTVEEADMLEQKLTEALDELRQHKEELRRRSST
jgi:hypothetical protein